jgi:hypothetical protein
MSVRILFYSLNMAALALTAIQARQPEQPSTAVVVASELGTAQWLRESCAAAVDLFARNDHELTATDLQSITPAWLMISGTMQGLVHASRILGPEKSPELFFPPPEWGSYDVVAQSILEFMQHHSDMIDSSTAVESVVAAWYFCEHPKAADVDKATGLNFLLKRKPVCDLRVGERARNNR